MSGSGKFFVFPLPLLSPDEDYKDTLQRIVSYCVSDLGEKSIEQVDEETTASAIFERTDDPSGYNEENEEHRHVKQGAIRLNVTVGSVTSSLARAKEAKAIIRCAEDLCGPSPLVFVGSSMLWGCHNKGFPSFRHFCVTCAVNSVIGKRRTPVLIRRDLIRARAAGWKTLDAYEAASGKAFKRRPLLTTDQLRWTLDKLEEADLFTRIVASPRRTFFSKADRTTAMAQVAGIVATGAARKISSRREEERQAMLKARRQA